MAVNIAQVFTGSVTQGGADAFAQAALQTGLEGQTRIGWKVLGLDFEIPRIPGIMAATNIELALSRRTKAAMPNITDLDVIKKIKLGEEGTTSGLMATTNIINWVPDGEVIIVEPSLYFLVDSNATTLTQTVYFRLEYELVTLTEVERLSLLTRSLAS